MLAKSNRLERHARRRIDQRLVRQSPGSNRKSHDTKILSSSLQSATSRHQKAKSKPDIQKAQLQTYSIRAFTRRSGMLSQRLQLHQRFERCILDFYLFSIFFVVVKSN